MSNYTYTIKIALSNPMGLSKSNICEALQVMYDGSVLAGTFTVEMVGTSTAIVTFSRSIYEDADATSTRLADMSVTWAMDQMRKELADGFDFRRFIEGHPIALVMQALQRHDCTVEGLPCQQPLVRLFVEVAFPDHRTKDYFVSSTTETGVRQAVAEHVPGGVPLSARLLHSDGNGLEASVDLL